MGGGAAAQGAQHMCGCGLVCGKDGAWSSTGPAGAAGSDQAFGFCFAAWLSCWAACLGPVPLFPMRFLVLLVLAPLLAPLCRCSPLVRSPPALASPPSCPPLYLSSPSFSAPSPPCRMPARMRARFGSHLPPGPALGEPSAHTLAAPSGLPWCALPLALTRTPPTITGILSQHAHPSLLSHQEGAWGVCRC